MSPLTPITTPLSTGADVVDVFIADERYALIATSGTSSGGIEVLDMLEGAIVGSGTLPDFPTCVAADLTTSTGSMYIGTSNSGIYTVRYHPSRRIDFTSNLVQKFTTTSTPPISHNSIRDLDTLPGKLLIGTASGVDFIAGEVYRSRRLLVSGVNDVHFTTAGGGYWTTKSGNAGEVEVNYSLISTTGTGIIGVEFTYSTTSVPALPDAPPRDIAISESTPRTLAFATSSGALLTQEFPGLESTAPWTHVVSNVIGQDNVSTAVDFSPGASYNTTGLLYVTTTGSLYTLGLINLVVSGTHLPYEGTRDQVLLSGTITSMRTTGVL